MAMKFVFTDETFEHGNESPTTDPSTLGYNPFDMWYTSPHASQGGIHHPGNESHLGIGDEVARRNNIYSAINARYVRPTTTCPAEDVTSQLPLSDMVTHTRAQDYIITIVPGSPIPSSLCPSTHVSLSHQSCAWPAPLVVPPSDRERRLEQRQRKRDGLPRVDDVDTFTTPPRNQKRRRQEEGEGCSSGEVAPPPIVDEAPPVVSRPRRRPLFATEVAPATERQDVPGFTEPEDASHEGTGTTPVTPNFSGGCQDCPRPTTYNPLYRSNRAPFSPPGSDKTCRAPEATDQGRHFYKKSNSPGRVAALCLYPGILFGQQTWLPRANITSEIPLYDTRWPTVGLSITIGFKKRDVPVEFLDLAYEWIKTFTIAGGVSLERGDRLKHQHCQVFVAAHSPSDNKAMDRIKLHLSMWFDYFTNTSGHISVKVLDETVGHCFLPMVGYVFKQRGQAHFRAKAWNLSRDFIIACIVEYMKAKGGVDDSGDHRTTIYHKTWIPSTASFWREHLQGLDDCDPVRLLVWMLSTGEYKLDDKFYSDSYILKNDDIALNFFKVLTNPTKATRAMLLSVVFGTWTPPDMYLDMGDMSNHDIARHRYHDTSYRDKVSRSRIQWLRDEADGDVHGELTFEEAKARSQLNLRRLGVALDSRGLVPRPDIVTDDDSEEEQAHDRGNGAQDNGQERPPSTRADQIIMDQIRRTEPPRLNHTHTEFDESRANMSGFGEWLTERGYRRGDSGPRYNRDVAAHNIRVQRRATFRVLQEENARIVTDSMAAAEGDADANGYESDGFVVTERECERATGDDAEEALSDDDGVYEEGSVDGSLDEDYGV